MMVPPCLRNLSLSMAQYRARTPLTRCTGGPVGQASVQLVRHQFGRQRVCGGLMFKAGGMPMRCFMISGKTGRRLRSRLFTKGPR
ncbi:hypothetical protein EMPG_11075 [Blastomyces silverae]|uniref:Uncharacterized protein n=1 Tax=Blastomyces silverae TaxID=2060906 RepID=A0A0H1B249_9EURO|nr:hypothetical protein EMPG_11075 [Blastomyces silverae]